MGRFHQTVVAASNSWSFVANGNFATMPSTQPVDPQQRSNSLLRLSNGIKLRTAKAAFIPVDSILQTTIYLEQMINMQIKFKL